MTPGIAALVGGGVAAGYVPILRGQIRDGEVGLPFGSINPIRIRRRDHPRLFRLAATALCVVVGLLIAACALILIRSVAG